MPRPKEEKPLVKVSLWVFKEDWLRLKHFYPRSGASKAFRKVLADHILGLRQGRLKPVKEEEDDS